MRRHVHDVARARHQRGEALRVRQRLLGLGRRLHRMDVEVDRAGMRRVALAAPSRARRRSRRRGPWARSRRPPSSPTAACPSPPRRTGSDGVVGREARGDGLHRVGIGLVERGAVGLGIVRHSASASASISARSRSRRPWPSSAIALASAAQRRRVRLRHHRHVDVGAEHQRLAPEAHRAVGIELLRRRNARCASAWLKPKARRTPWSNQACARGTRVPTLKASAPRLP